MSCRRLRLHEGLRRESRARRVRLYDARISLLRRRRLVHGRVMLLRLKRRRLNLPRELLKMLLLDVVGLRGHRQWRAEVQAEDRTGHIHLGGLSQSSGITPRRSQIFSSPTPAESPARCGRAPEEWSLCANVMRTSVSALAQILLLLLKKAIGSPSRRPWGGRDRSENGTWWTAEVRQRQEGNTTVIEGVFIDSPRKGFVVKPKHTSSACPLCRLGLKRLNHTDVLILSQFMDSRGNLLPRNVTGLCAKQHKIVGTLLYQAQRTGLIYNEEHIPKERWQELNNYFGRTKLKVDFGKPLIDIVEYLKKPPTT